MRRAPLFRRHRRGLLQQTLHFLQLPVCVQQFPGFVNSQRQTRAGSGDEQLAKREVVNVHCGGRRRLRRAYQIGRVFCALGKRRFSGDFEELYGEDEQLDACKLGACSNRSRSREGGAAGEGRRLQRPSFGRRLCSPREWALRRGLTAVYTTARPQVARSSEAKQRTCKRHWRDLFNHSRRASFTAAATEAVAIVASEEETPSLDPKPKAMRGGSRKHNKARESLTTVKGSRLK